MGDPEKISEQVRARDDRKIKQGVSIAGAGVARGQFLDASRGAAFLRDGQDGLPANPRHLLAVQGALGNFQFAQLAQPSILGYDPLKAATDRFSAAISSGDSVEIAAAEKHLDDITGAQKKIESEKQAEVIRKRFGSFLAPKILSGEMSLAGAARALTNYGKTEAGGRDLFFHDNAVNALAAKKRLAESNIGADSYKDLAAAPELLASGKYKYHQNYRKNKAEQRDDDYAEGKRKAWDEGGANQLFLFVEAQGREDPGQVVHLAKLSDDRAFHDALVAKKQAKELSQEFSDRVDICTQDLNDPADCAVHWGNELFGDRGQTASIDKEGKVEFTDAQLAGVKPGGHYYGREEAPRKPRTAEEEAWRKAVHDAQQTLIFDQVGKSFLRTLMEPGAMLADGGAWVGKQYAWAFGTDFHYKNQSMLSESISAELAKGDKANYLKLSGEIVLNVGTMLLMFVPGGQAGVLAKMMPWAGRIMTLGMGAMAMKQVVESRNRGDYMGAATAAGSLYGLMAMHYGMQGLGKGAAAFGEWRASRLTVESIYNPRVSLAEVVKYINSSRPPDIVADILGRTAGIGMADVDPRIAVDGYKTEVHNHIMGVPSTQEVMARVADGNVQQMVRQVYEFYSKTAAAQGESPNSWAAIQKAHRLLEMANRAPGQVDNAALNGQLGELLGQAYEAGPKTSFEHTYGTRDWTTKNWYPRKGGKAPSPSSGELTPLLEETHAKSRPRAAPPRRTPTLDPPRSAEEQALFEKYQQVLNDVMARLQADGIHYSEQSTGHKKINGRFTPEAMFNAEAATRQPGKPNVVMRFLLAFKSEMFAEGTADLPGVTKDFEETLKVAERTLAGRPDVIGFDIAGIEVAKWGKTGGLRMQQLMKVLFEASQKRGRNMVFRPHAGEGYMPPEGVADPTLTPDKVGSHNIGMALDAMESSQYMKPKNGVGVIGRIGHATHVTDAQLLRMQQLRSRASSSGGVEPNLDIIAESNISSNVATQVIPRLYSPTELPPLYPGGPSPEVCNHPLLRNFYTDTPTILSTDAHGVMNTTLTREYAIAGEILQRFKAGELVLPFEGKMLRYNELPPDVRAKFDINRLWQWQAGYWNTMQMSAFPQ